MAERDRQTFLTNIKAKYPQYAKMDDATLYSTILKKYPQYKDVDFNKIPGHENFLQKIARNALSTPEGSSLLGGLIGGPMMGSAGISRVEMGERDQQYPEDILPFANALPGALLKGAGGYGAEVAGAGLGETERQFIKGLRGEKPEYGKVGTSAASTALLSGIPRSLGAFFLAKPSTQAAKQAAGKVFEGSKERLIRAGGKGAKIPFPWIKESLNKAVKKAIFETDRVAKDLRGLTGKVKTEFSKTGVPIDEALLLESKLGRMGHFTSEFGKKIKEGTSDALDKAIKLARKEVSGYVDRRASSLGVPEYGNVSRSYSKAAGTAEKYSRGMSGFLSKAFGGGEIGAAIASPIRAVEFLGEVAYPYVFKTGLGKAGRIASTEIERKFITG